MLTDVLIVDCIYRDRAQNAQGALSTGDSASLIAGRDASLAADLGVSGAPHFAHLAPGRLLFSVTVEFRTDIP
jgi:hypothetical protein